MKNSLQRDEPRDGAAEGVDLVGAKHLADTLRTQVAFENEPPIAVEIKMPPKGYKDFRAWYNAIPRP